MRRQRNFRIPATVPITSAARATTADPTMADIGGDPTGPIFIVDRTGVGITVATGVHDFGARSAGGIVVGGPATE